MERQTGKMPGIMGTNYDTITAPEKHKARGYPRPVFRKISFKTRQFAAVRIFLILSHCAGALSMLNWQAPHTLGRTVQHCLQ